MIKYVLFVLVYGRSRNLLKTNNNFLPSMHVRPTPSHSSDIFITMVKFKHIISAWSSQKKKKNKFNRFRGFLSPALHPFKISQRHCCYFYRSQFSGSCFLGNVRATFWQPIMHRYNSNSKESQIFVFNGHLGMGINSTVKVMQKKKKSFTNSLYRECLSPFF